MTDEPLPPDRPARVTWLVVLLSSLASLLLVWIGLEQWDRYRVLVGSTFDLQAGFEYWLLGSLAFVVSGVVAGAAIGGWQLGAFHPLRALGFGVLPLLVAVTRLVWVFAPDPVAQLPGRLVNVLVRPEISLVAWFLVGTALALGFQRRRGE